MEWVARALGAFYLLGGLYALKAARENNFYDKVLAAIDLTPTPAREKVRAATLWGGAFLTAAGGLALLLLSRWSVWIFALNLVLQLAYLLWAARWLKPEDEADAIGRKRTQNAAIIWGGATLAVIWWTREGLLA